MFIQIGETTHDRKIYYVITRVRELPIRLTVGQAYTKV